MLIRMKAIVFLTCIGVSIMSCGGSFNTEPFIDTYTDEDGNELMADTPRMWQDFVELTERRIERELNLKRPPGVETWNEHWISSFDAHKKYTQNPEKYINYIIHQRRKAGLPELIFPE